MAAPETAGSAEEDYAAVRPAALAAATAGCPLVVAWLSRGDGADLELITMTPPAALARRGKHAAPVAAASGPAADGTGGTAGGPLLFPPGARAEPARDRAAELEQLVWAPCLAGPASPEEPSPEEPSPDRAGPAGGPGVFETALIALMRRPFGWLMVAEPTDLLDAETAGLRTELDILRRHQQHRAAGAAEQTERRLAERGTFGAAGLWRVHVLAGASTPGELDVLAPLLAGAAELGPHPYRLRHTTGAHSLEAALAARHHDPADGAQSPFFVTAGTLTALAGLPRACVPGLELVRPPGQDPVSEPAGDDPAAD
ncbi:MAG TPA: ATP-binding protein, partial [Streptosporangiaceae bacterium]